MHTAVLTSFTLLCLVSTVFPMGIDISVNAFPDLPVHNLDTGLDYATIQEAIDASETSDGNSIYVEAGTYYENVVLNKTIALMGENSSTTIIDGNQTESVFGSNIVYVNVNNVMISGFTLRNAFRTDVSGIGCGIKVYSHSRNCTIIDNRITNCYMGIEVWSDCKIRGNQVFDNYGGIVLLNPNNSLRNNKIFNNTCNFGYQHFGYKNDVDGSNTVNGKPICCLRNQNDLLIDPFTFPD